MASFYLEPIGGGFILFVLAAAVLWLPYSVWQYRKRGRVGRRRLIAESLFLLYLFCAWALVLMPFPSSSEVACAREVSSNLQPFAWWAETQGYQSANGGDWYALLTAPSLVIRLFNVALTVPFGIFLRRWFRLSFPVTVLAGAALSLAFELTQHTGIWFLYDCGYRSFDVDDIIANTAGAGLGWLIAPAMFFVPRRQEADDLRATDPVASVGRRAIAIIVDLLTWGTFCVLGWVAVLLVVRQSDLRFRFEILVALVVFAWLLLQVVLPWLASGSTVGTGAVAIRVQKVDGARPGPIALIGRFVLTWGVFAAGTVLFVWPSLIGAALPLLLAGVGWWILLGLWAMTRRDRCTPVDLITRTRVVAGNPADSALPHSSTDELAAIPR